MRAAVDGTEIVCIGLKYLVVTVVVHERDINFSVTLYGSERDGLLMKRCETALVVYEVYKLGDTALEAIDLRFFPLGILTEVGESYFKSRVEECLLAKSLLESIEFLTCGLLENLRVGLETDCRTCFGCVAYDFERINGIANLETHGMDMSVLTYLILKPLGERVYD